MIDQPSTFNEELYQVKEKTTVIISKAWNEITEAEKEQLQKILQAVRLKLASVQILHQNPLDLARLRPQPSRMIYFGEPVPGLSQYEPIKTEGTIVLAPHLSLLQNDPGGKQKLWIALKALFGL